MPDRAKPHLRGGGRHRKRNDEPSRQAELPVVEDPRFASMHEAPKFRRPRREDRTVKVDERFAAVLSDERFGLPKARFDKRGRPNKLKSAPANELAAFYSVDGTAEAEGAATAASKVADDRFDKTFGAAQEGNGQKARSARRAGGKTQSGKAVKPARRARDPEERLDYLNRLARGEISASSHASSSAGASDSEASSSNSDSEAASSADEAAGTATAVTGSSNNGDEPAAAVPSQRIGGGLGGEATRERIPTGEETRRLAVMNCDWDHMRAVDLMVLCSSFCPGQEAIRSVAVYPSDYGLAKMAEERARGPQAFLAADASSGDVASAEAEQAEQDAAESEGSGEESSDAEQSEASGGEEGENGTQQRRAGLIFERGSAADGAGSEDEAGDRDEDFDPEKLRAYELQKLKYYFAVLDCSSAAAASAIYREADGLEVERSGVALDLRFVPDDVDFSTRGARDKCEAPPASYEPPAFVCRALQQTRVECTWDEVPADRLKLMAGTGRWRDTAEDDFEAYLASGDSEESDGSEEGGNGEGKGADKMRRLLLGDDMLSSDGEEAGGRLDAVNGAGNGWDGIDAPGKSASGRLGGSKTNGKVGRRNAGDGEGDVEFTFTPGLAKDILQRKKEKEERAGETPWEAQQRQAREKRRARNAEKKAAAAAADDNGREEEDDFFAQDGADGDGLEVAGAVEEKRKSHRKRRPGKDKDDAGEVAAQSVGMAESSAAAQASSAAVVAEEAEEDARDFDMRALQREERLRGKRLRGKRKRKEDERPAAPGRDFAVDLGDERFAALIGGDERFGIDRTDAAFKETEGMKTIISERQRQRRQRLRNADSGGGGKGAGDGGEIRVSGGDAQAPALSSLVKKLQARGLAQRKV